MNPKPLEGLSEDQIRKAMECGDSANIQDEDRGRGSFAK